MMSSSRNKWIVAGLLTGALAVRLWGVLHARFDLDESLIWSEALDIAQTGIIPGISEAGRPSGSGAALPGAAVPAVAALAHLKTNDPLASAILVALLSVAGLWLFYKALALGWSETGAETTVLLAVASPLAVTMADRLWNPNFSPAIGAMVFLSMALSVKGRYGISTSVGIAALLVAPQFHLSALVLILISAAFVTWKRPCVPWRWLVPGFALATLAYLKYFSQEWAAGFTNTKMLLLGSTSGHHSLSFRGLFSLIYLFLATGIPDASYLLARGFWGGFDPVDFWLGPGRAAVLSRLGWTAWIVLPTLALGFCFSVLGLVRLAKALKDPLDPDCLVARLTYLTLSALGLFYLLTGRGFFAHYTAFVSLVAFVPVAAALRLFPRLRPIYLVAATICGLLQLRTFYARDSRQSIPLQESVVRAVIATTRDQQMFELNLQFPEGQAVTYARLARRGMGARWAVTDRAAEVFTVFQGDSTEGMKVSGRVVSTRPIPGGTLVHSRR